MMISKPRGASGRGPVAARAIVAGAALAAGLAASTLAPASAAVAMRSTSAGSTAARSAAAPAAAGSSAAGSSVTGSSAAVSQRTITLLNGDRVLVTRSAQAQEDAVAPAGSAVNRALVRMDLAGHAYEVPAEAVPFLGRGLSPSLFEVSSLLAAESGGRLPVQVNYEGALHSLPGVTITKSGGGTAQGYLTAKSAVAFGAALARQMAADHARGSYGSDGMFAGGLSIGLRGQATATPARPDYPMHTLTVTGTDLTGRPDTGDTVGVVSADNLARFGQGFNDIFSSFYRGVAKYSVPSGHYLAIGFFDVMSGKTITGVRTVVLPQFTVSGDATVAMAESAATEQVQIVTPRPAVAQDISLTIDRAMAHRTPATDSFDVAVDSGTLPQWVNATKPVTVGTLRSWLTARLTSPAGAGQQYEYDLAFAGPAGRIGSQRYVVTADNVAAVHAAYYQDGASTGAWLPAALFQPASGFSFVWSEVYPFTLPESETQYTSAYTPASGGPFWDDSYQPLYQALAGGQYDTVRKFVPGSAVTVGWNAYPLQPSPTVNLLGTASPFADLPTASRAGNTLTVNEIPFGDNTPGHTGSGLSTGFPPTAKTSGSYELDQNGTNIASGKMPPYLPSLLLQATLSSQPATDRLVLNATRTGSLYQLSTKTQTVWTWQSVPEPHAVLPAGWTCLAGNQDCAVQPLMTLQYQVAEMGLDGAAPAGSQLVAIKAGQLQLVPASPVTAMAVSVSFNGGKTWLPAAVSSLGGGRFAAAFVAPEASYVSLRVQASDRAGSSIAQTVTRAYQTGF